LDYSEIVRVIKSKDPKRFLSTIEFFPEEGKYHFDGHRNCNILYSPPETRAHKGTCPVCGRKLTVGVMNRVEELADRPEGYKPANAIPGIHLVPLREIIAEALGVGVESVAVEREYFKMVEKGKSEFKILLELTQEELVQFTPSRIVEGIMKVREGQIKIIPGYDGVFGKIQIFGASEQKAGGDEESKQLRLF
jgi:PHP family Zn ribbon phosphoesterase